VIHLHLVVGVAGVLAASGGGAITLRRWPRAAGGVAVGGAIASGVVGLGASIDALRAGAAATAAIGWQVPGGALVVGIDPLTAFFLVPLFGLGALVAIYGRSYFADARSSLVPSALLDLLLAAMAVVLLARHTLVFLVAWESMTLLAYLLVTVDHKDAAVRRAGWAYVLASHVAMLALIALFLGLGEQAGGALDFASFHAAGAAAPAVAWGLFALAVVGFGIKSGVIGLHVWLPEAHAAAPSPVSALMSGALIKLGVYGLLRTISFLPPTAGFGIVLMSLGVVGALVGIALALYQRDLKRALAYSSVENVGIALVGLGLGTWAHARGSAAVAVLGYAGGLLHIWNHAAMKGLLFLGAGSVVHATGTRDIERLGGLLRRMPWTAAAVITGAVAIAALPPLNAFVSEWLLYRGLIRAGLERGGWSLPALGGVALLALVGGLAALCFVRLIGVVLLGQPRSDAAREAHEGPPGVVAPVVLLALICVAIALAPGAVVGVLAPLVACLAGTDEVAVAVVRDAVAPLVVCNAALLAILAVVGAIAAALARRAAADETWGCGYAAPGPRMQYTGRGFAETVADRLLPRRLRPRRDEVAPAGLFPERASLSTDSTDPLTRGFYEPFLIFWGERFVRLRRFKQGSLHVYLLYILAAAVLGLGWAGVRDWWGP